MALRHPVGSGMLSTASHSTVRRRQIVLGLVGLTAVAIVGAVGTGAPAAWWAVAGLALIGAIYAMLLHRVRRVAIEREFSARFGIAGSVDVGSLTGAVEIGAPSHEVAIDGGVAPVGPATTGRMPQVAAMARFCIAYAAGWALSPLVFALALLARETPRDTTSQRWLANLQAAQERLRDESLRTFAVSAATTASVTAAGTIAALGGPAAANAATMTSAATSTGLPANLPSTGNPSLQYRVTAGDSLWSIARAYGTTVEQLSHLNFIANPDLIFPGQLLSVPGAGLAGRERSGQTTYVVQEGDSLWSIAARFDTTVSVLAATNNIADPSLILPGQVLILRGRPESAVTTITRRTAPRYQSTGTSTRPVVRRSPSKPAPPRRAAPATGHHAPGHHAAEPAPPKRATLTGAHPVADPAPPKAAAPAAPHPAADPAPLSAAQRAVQAALAQVGKPYQWGGAGPNSFDCSGLVMYAWASAGVQLPHYSVGQYDDTTRIAEGELRPGDLVFYDTGDGAQPGHVTIYIGNGQIVTADSAGTDIRVETLTWDGRPMGFGRVG